MLKIGVTGGIGSGKSYVCREFGKFGIPVFYSDIAAKKCHMDPDIQEMVKRHFGEETYIDGILDRKRLGDIVFNDKKELEVINSIIHPAVHKRFEDWISEQSSPYVLYESAILFESGLQKDFDVIITIYCPKEIRIERAMERDSLTREQIVARIKNQIHDGIKMDLSHFVIFNDGEKDLEGQITRTHNALVKITNKIKTE